MYAISNHHRDETIKLLAALKALPGNDIKTINIKRKAGIMIKKLNKAKYITTSYNYGTNK